MTDDVIGKWIAGFFMVLCVVALLNNIGGLLGDLAQFFFGWLNSRRNDYEQKQGPLRPEGLDQRGARKAKAGAEVSKTSRSTGHAEVCGDPRRRRKISNASGVA